MGTERPDLSWRRRALVGSWGQPSLRATRSRIPRGPQRSQGGLPDLRVRPSRSRPASCRSAGRPWGPEARASGLHSFVVAATHGSRQVPRFSAMQTEHQAPTRPPDTGRGQIYQPQAEARSLHHGEGRGTERPGTESPHTEGPAGRRRPEKIRRETGANLRLRANG